MNDNPKMWIGTPGEDDWCEVGEVTDLNASLKDPNVDFEPFDPGVPITPIQDSYVVDMKLTSNVDTVLEFAKKYIGAITPEQEQLYRSVMVVGTRKLAHVHPGPWSPRFEPWMPDHVATFYGATKRVEHTRARKLYSERLRRDRRRKRKGRAPILRSGPNVRALFPRVQVDRVERRGDTFGMRVIASPHLDAGQVVVTDTQLIDHVFREPPKIFDYDDRPRIRGYQPSGYFLNEAHKFTGLDPS